MSTGRACASHSAASLRAAQAASTMSAMPKALAAHDRGCGPLTGDRVCGARCPALPAWSSASARRGGNAGQRLPSASPVCVVVSGNDSVAAMTPVTAEASGVVLPEASVVALIFVKVAA